MRCFVFGSSAFVLIAATTAMAQFQPLNQPQPAQPPGKVLPRPTAQGPWSSQPSGFPTTRVTASRMAVLEEDLELVEAQRRVRRAHVHAAEIGVKSALINAERLERIAKTGVVSNEELDRAKLEVEAAKRSWKSRKQRCWKST